MESNPTPPPPTVIALLSSGFISYLCMDGLHHWLHLASPPRVTWRRLSCCQSTSRTMQTRTEEDRTCHFQVVTFLFSRAHPTFLLLLNDYVRECFVDVERDYLCLTKQYPRLAITPEFSKVGHFVHWTFVADRYSMWLLAFSVTLARSLDEPHYWHGFRWVTHHGAFIWLDQFQICYSLVVTRISSFGMQ